MAKITYPQQLPEDANSIKHVSIGQTRDGKDEFITPVTIWEVDKSTGKHVPAGGSAEVNAPRVKLDTEAQTTLEAVQAELELVKSELQTIKTNQLSGNQKVQLYGNIEAFPIFSVHQIRDTNTHSVTIDLSKYRRVWIVAYSDHDKNPSLTIRHAHSIGSISGGLKVFDGQNWVVPPEIELERYILFPINTQYTWLDNAKVKDIRVSLKCSTAPTTGVCVCTAYGEVF